MLLEFSGRKKGLMMRNVAESQQMMRKMCLFAHRNNLGGHRSTQGKNPSTEWALFPSSWW